MVIICVMFWFFVVVVVGVFHLERVVVGGVFIGESVSFCINFEQPLVTRGRRLNLFVL